MVNLIEKAAAEAALKAGEQEALKLAEKQAAEVAVELAKKESISLLEKNALEAAKKLAADEAAHAIIENTAKVLKTETASAAKNQGIAFAKKEAADAALQLAREGGDNVAIKAAEDTLNVATKEAEDATKVFSEFVVDSAKADKSLLESAEKLGASEANKTAKVLVATNAKKGLEDVVKNVALDGTETTLQKAGKFASACKNLVGRNLLKTAAVGATIGIIIAASVLYGFNNGATLVITDAKTNGIDAGEAASYQVYMDHPLV